MTGSIRLLLSPIWVPNRDPVPVTGCLLDLTRHGSGVTKAREDAQPAKFEFVGRFTSSVRDRPAPQERPLGELSGAVELRGTPPSGFFHCDEVSLARLREEPEAEESDEDQELVRFAPLALELRFSAAFDAIDEAADKPRLFLPADAGNFRYLEVVARLTVNGSPEAEFDQNDILDVLIRTQPPQAYPFSL